MHRASTPLVGAHVSVCAHPRHTLYFGGGMAFSFRRLAAALAFAPLLPLAASAQEPATLTGRVTGEGGIGLSSVAVTIPELGLGSGTRDDGTYTIVIPGGRVTRQAVTITARR